MNLQFSFDEIIRERHWIIFEQKGLNLFLAEQKDHFGPLPKTIPQRENWDFKNKEKELEHHGPLNGKVLTYRTDEIYFV